MAGILRPKYAAPAPDVRLREVMVGAPGRGRRVGDLVATLPAGVKIVAVRQDDMNQPPIAEVRLRDGDGLLLAGNPAGLDEATRLIGREDPGHLSHDRAHYDVVRVYLSRPSLVGRRLDAITLPDFPVMISHVRRGDAEVIASSDLLLEYGDCLVTAVPVGRQDEARRFFGDSIKGNAEMSFVSVGVGMALGLLLGMVPIPLPGGGRFALGVAGGPLVMGLVLGWLGRTGPIGWRMPVVANLVLRNLGLSIFIGAVALGAGAPFATTVAANGLPILLGGAAVLLTLVLIVLAGGMLLRIPFDDLLGVCAGATGNPAILVAAARLAPTDRPDVGYAMAFPCATIVKIIAVQLLLR
jgi:putative transport protein